MHVPDTNKGSFYVQSLLQPNAREKKKKKNWMQVLCGPSSLSKRNRKIFDHEIYADIIYTRQETSLQKKLIKKKKEQGG